MSNSKEVHEHWNAYMIFVSFVLVFMASYSTVCLAEQYRIAASLKGKLISQRMYLVLMAITLGGGIWSMHFIGMSAVTFHDREHNEIKLKFDWIKTLMSLITCIICMYTGFFISSRDKMFSRDKEEIFALIVEEGKKDSMAAVKSKHYLMKVALFRGMGPLVVGGVIAGGGVCVMHYIGMLAMHGKMKVHWNAGIVFASVLIAIVAATAAYWILFRLLALFPKYESLRLLSSFIAACAVCGMHYTGMAAASYTVHDDPPAPLLGAAMDQNTANILALASGVMMSWGSSMAVQAELRAWHMYLAGRVKAARKVLDDLHQRYGTDAVLQTYYTENGKIVSSHEVDRQETSGRNGNQKVSESKVMPSIPAGNSEDQYDENMSKYDVNQVNSCSRQTEGTADMSTELKISSGTIVDEYSCDVVDIV